ncbi:MAG: MFS transporter, partial [Acidimicrobiales bacterium]
AGAGDATAAGKATDRRALAVMVVSHAVQHFYVGGLALTYPLVVVDFHISYGLLGAVLTVAGLVGGLLQGVAGLVRRSSARAVLAVQNVGLAAATALGAIAPGFAVFGAARCMGAIVSWPQHPVGSAYLSERFPGRRGAVLSWHTAGGSLGTVVVPLIASAVIATAGWRWALVAIAIPMAAGGVLVWFRLPPDRHTEPEDAASAGTRVPLRAVLTRRRVALILAAATVAAGGRGLGTISAYLPAYLKTGLHLSTYEVGGVFTAVMVASVAGPVAAGHLADRFGRGALLVVSYLAGAAALVAFVFVGSGLAALVATGVAMGMFAYAESPLLQAVFADAVGEAAGRAAFGAFFAIAYGIGALWLAVLGWVIDAFGFRAAFVVMAGSFVMAAALVVASGSGRAPRQSGAVRAPVTAPDPDPAGRA